MTEPALKLLHPPITLPLELKPSSRARLELFAISRSPETKHILYLTRSSTFAVLQVDLTVSITMERIARTAPRAISAHLATMSLFSALPAPLRLPRPQELRAPSALLETFADLSPLRQQRQDGLQWTAMFSQPASCSYNSTLRPMAWSKLAQEPSRLAQWVSRALWALHQQQWED